MEKNYLVDENSVILVSGEPGDYRKMCHQACRAVGM
jgi:hypothetical protein